jgi:two-component system, cell cycle sensor histidine kinase PleC
MTKTRTNALTETRITERTVIAPGVDTVGLRAAIDSIDDGLTLWDADDCLESWNHPIERMFPLVVPLLRVGVSFEDFLRQIVGLGYLDLGDLDAEGFVRHYAEQHLAASGSYELAVGDGRILTVRERRTGNGGTVQIIADSTSAKRREAELHQAKDNAEAANRSKSTFLANMSHELRTPLNAIIGFSDLVMSEAFGPLGSPKYQEYAADINNSGAHLLQVINYILDLSRVEAGRYELRRERLRPKELIDEVLRVLSVSVSQADIELVVNAPANLPLASLDRRAIRQVLLNLVSNSMKFTLAGGTITIAASADARLLTLAVGDTGIGIPKDDLPRLANPFEQVANSMTKSHEGSGLGLAISRELVRLHGGTFTIESEVGVGTTVTLSLPLDPAQH